MNRELCTLCNSADSSDKDNKIRATIFFSSWLMNKASIELASNAYGLWPIIISGHTYLSVLWFLAFSEISNSTSDIFTASISSFPSHSHVVVLSEKK